MMQTVWAVIHEGKDAGAGWTLLPDDALLRRG